MTLLTQVYRSVFLSYIVLFSHSILNAQYDNRNLTFHQSSLSSFDGTFDVVIDPGHGGSDKGCTGSICHEKDVVLELALELGKSLQMQNHNIRVHYTRTSDEFVSLADRIKFANDLGGDLFLSLHFNADSHQYVNGSETYVGGLDFVHAHDEDHHGHGHSIIDNATKQELKKYELNNSDKMVVLKQSLDLAAMIEGGFERDLPFKSRGVKEAGFAVLKYINMPGALIEAGFLTNKKQEKFINSKEGIQEMSTCLSNSVTAFLSDLEQQYHSLNRSLVVTKNHKQKPVVTNIPINKEPKSFAIKVASSAKMPILNFDKKWDNLKAITVKKSGNTFHYLTGQYDSPEDAKAQLTVIRGLGFEHAYVTEIKSSSPKRKAIKYTAGD